MATGRGSAGRIAVDFVNQGSSSSSVMGHGRVEAALRKSFADSDVIDARFVSLPPWTPLQRAASADWPPLSRYDLDMQALRWHLVEGHRARVVVRSLLGERRPDLLHVSSHVAAFRIADLGIPYIVNVDATVDQWESMELPWRPRRRYSSRLLGLSRRLERRAFERAAAIVAMSEWSAEGVRAVVPDAEVHVIHPGLDLDLYRPATPEERAEVGTDTVRVLFVGGRFEEKGGPLLLEAMEPLLGHGFELDLVTSKRGVDTPWMRWHQLPPEDPRLLRLYRLADVLCLPTYRDAVPWVVLEAFASGTPVIASDTGALPAMLIRCPSRGVVLPARDAGALRVAVGTVIKGNRCDDRRERSARESFDLRSNAHVAMELLLPLARQESSDLV
jgi:glycosyltransferase involved in cell wall biosynthesis